MMIQVMSCDDYPIQCLSDEKFLLIICSTSGLGDAPLNMKIFWRFLMRKDLPTDSLDHLQFAVIGLGDSSYAKYNFVAKKLFKRLRSLGAKNLLDLVLGDEQHEFGPFYTIDPWLQEFYQLIIPESNISKLTDDEGIIEPSINIVELLFDGVHGDDDSRSTLSLNDHSNLMKSNSKYDQLNPFEARVIDNKRITADDHFQDVRLIELELDSTIQYKLTDVCVVYPKNHSEQVDLFLSLFDSNDDDEGRNRLEADQMVRLELNQQQYWIPQSSYYHHLIRHRNPCTIREIITRYMDINSIPKRSFFDLFYRFSRDQLERSKLKRFASGADLDELYDYVNRPKRTILEVMVDFPNTTPYVPLKYLFDLIPAMAWRSYSIASSPLCKPNSIQILYAVVEYRTRLKKPRLGQCTTWMARQEPNLSNLDIFLRTSSFKLPDAKLQRPLIMIAAGAGVAPFRAFIHDRVEQNIGKNYLFFGCRFRDKDYYLRDEWQPFIERKLLTVFTAFSRENPDQKIYVQHVVWQQRDLFYRLFNEQNAIILIAGKSKQYPELVRETLTDIFREKQQNDDHNDGDDYYENLISKFESQKRIQFESKSFGVNYSTTTQQHINRILLSSGLITAAGLFGLNEWQRVRCAECRSNDQKRLRPNSNEELALFDAIRKNDSVKIDKLLKGNPNLYVNTRHALGWTPLHLAATLGRSEIVQQLLEAGADPDAIDEFSNAGQIAHEHRLRYYDVLRIREHEFNDMLANNVSFLGTTALHYACLASSIETIKILMRHKANPHVENEFGHKPIDYLDDQDTEIISFIPVMQQYMQEYGDYIEKLKIEERRKF
ncbi:NADPH-dependent diflavin oxidoreductase 1-like protein, partial [Euroglyphus maynei]